MLESSNQLGYKTEVELIIACSRTRIPVERMASISSMLREQLDWDYIFDVASRNAVFPLLVWNLLNHFNESLSAEIEEKIAAAFQEHLRANMFRTAKLLEIVRLFKSCNIPILPFKGPMLAVQAYGNLSLRKYGDLDVLVPPKHFAAAVELLKENDYTPITNVNWLKRSDWYVSDKKDIYFTNRDRSVNLELHWKLSGSHFAVPLEMHRLWQQTETLNLAGTEVNTLSFTDLLIYLCLHGSRHSWERFGWICDVHELICSHENIDWELLNAEAVRLGCKNVVGLALRQVHEFFGLSVPVSNWNTIINDSTFEEIVADTRHRLFSPETLPIIIGDRYSYHLKLKEKVWDKWKLHFHYAAWYSRIIILPNEADKSLFYLPRSLTALYFVTRPFRLFFTFIKGKKEPVSKTT